MGNWQMEEVVLKKTDLITILAIAFCCSSGMGNI
jgi:hypothetical protein